jgi:hypothetical protein
MPNRIEQTQQSIDRLIAFVEQSPCRGIYKLLNSFAFSHNKTEESIKIIENEKGELKLKDKSLDAKDTSFFY